MWPRPTLNVVTVIGYDASSNAFRPVLTAVCLWMDHSGRILMPGVLMCVFNVSWFGVCVCVWVCVYRGYFAITGTGLARTQSCVVILVNVFSSILLQWISGALHPKGLAWQLSGSRASMKRLCNHNHRAPATVPKAEEEVVLPCFISSNSHPHTCQKWFLFLNWRSRSITPPANILVVLNSFSRCSPLQMLDMYMF